MPWVDRTAQFRKLAGADGRSSSSVSGRGVLGRTSAGGVAPLPVEVSPYAVPGSSPGKKSAPSQFHAMARSLGEDISKTTLKLAHLAKLTRSSKLHSDKGEEIAECTMMIKHDMEALHDRFRQVQQFQDAHRSRDVQVDSHKTQVISTLKQKLMSAKDQFEEVLHKRTEDIKRQQERRSRFVSSPAIKAPGGGAGKRRSLQGQQGGPAAFAAKEESGEVSGERQQQLMSRPQQQQLMLREEDLEQEHYEQRARAVQQIESTLVELSHMFQDLHQLVQDQEEMVQRVDTNVEAALLDLEQGQSQLALYLEGLKSSRWLVFKVMMVLVIFIMFFAVFMM